MRTYDLEFLDTLGNSLRHDNKFTFIALRLLLYFHTFLMQMGTESCKEKWFQWKEKQLGRGTRQDGTMTKEEWLISKYKLILVTYTT